MSETFEDIVVDVSKMETTTPTREKSSAVGNAAAMRNALEKVRRVLHCAIVADILKGDDVNSAFNEVTAALSAPPRNCDRQLPAESVSADGVEKAWIAFKRCIPDVYFDVPGLWRFIVWLFAGAKGESK